MVVAFFVTYFICKQNLIEVFKNNTSNKDVKTPKKVAVEKLDINDLYQVTIEESINSGSTIVPNEGNNVTEEDINNANTNTSNTTFSPNLSCTREQIVTMLYRYNNTL